MRWEKEEGMGRDMSGFAARRSLFALSHRTQGKERDCSQALARFANDLSGGKLKNLLKIRILRTRKGQKQCRYEVFQEYLKEKKTTKPE